MDIHAKNSIKLRNVFPSIKMNNNVIPTVYQAVWIEGQSRGNKYGHLEGKLREMKDELMMKDQRIAEEQALFKNHLEVEKEKAERLRKQSAREGYMHGIKTAFPYTVETSYLKNDF